MEIDPILLLTAFAGGYLVSHWQCRHHLLINLALRAELMGMRRRVHCDQSDKTSKVPPYKRKLSRRLPQPHTIRPPSGWHSRSGKLFHMTNNDFPPDAPEKLPVIIPFPERNVGNVKSVSWVGGFHHSYCWAA